MDRGLAYGDGVFRTLPVREGRLQCWQRHYRKLAYDCAALGIACPAQVLLESEVRRVCAQGGDHALKIIVTRGAGARGYAYSGEYPPTRIIVAAPLPDYPRAYRHSGVKVRRCRLTLAQQPALGGIKHLNRLENVLARAEWSAPDIAEGILCDGAGHAIGGTMCNLFIVQDEALMTPKVSMCGVAGVTRDRVIEAAARYGLSCEVRELPWSAVQAADEVFLVNSLAGVWPVREIEGRAKSPGVVTRLVQGWLEQESDA